MSVDTTPPRHTLERKDTDRHAPSFIHSLIEAMPDGIIVVDEAGRISMVNRRLEDMLRYGTGELTGEYMERLVPDNVRARHADLRRDYADSATDVRPMGLGLDLAARRKDGTDVPVDISLTRLSTPSGAFTVASVREATRQRQIDRERRIHEWAIECSTDPMVFTDTSGDVTGVNRAFSEQCRHPAAEDPTGRHISEFLRFHDPVSWERAKSCSGTAEWATVQAGRSHLDVRSSAVHDDRGELLCCFYAIHDTTENVLAYRALGEAERRLRRGQSVARLGYWEWYPLEGRWWVSEQVFETLDIPNGEGRRLPHDLWRQVHPADRRALLDALRSSTTLGAAFDLELRVGRENDEAAWIRVKGEPVLDVDDTAPHVVGTTLDISERVQLERRLRHAQTLEAIGQLAGGVAHDFNNLLTAIIGHTDLVQEDTALSDNARLDLQEIKHAAQRASALTRQLLAFSRRQILAPRTVCVNTAVLEALKLVSRAEGSPVSVRTELSDATPQTFMDPSQLEQVLYNLLTNARDATEIDGDIVVSTRLVSLAARDGDGAPLESAEVREYVQLEVRDTGTGMDPEVHRRCFEPFFTTKGVGAGTGLGLSSVYGILTQSGGAVEIQSEPGGGTTVEILLPRAPQAPTPPPKDCEAPSF